MSLCKFFQLGTCRFGSKCHNEHFDAKQVLKTDVESAINGKQWPLSAYGPFKDKPNIPNFIEDRSFEEVRLMCYEAKQKNFFEQFVQQFTAEINDATYKMKALAQMTPDILDVVIQVYNSPGADNTPPAAKSSNPFGMPAGGSSTAGSIFAKSSSGTASNIFGAGASSGGFGSTNAGGGGIFGGGNNQQAGNIFGGGTSAFAPAQQQQQSSIFSQAPKPPGGSIFGGGSSASQQMTMFGQQQSVPVGGNLFTQAAQQQSVTPFSQQQPQLQTAIFAQSQQQHQSNIFNQSGATATNIFAQTAQPPAIQQQGLFAQATSGMPAQPSAGQGIFGQAANQLSMQQPANTGQGLFAQTTQQTQNIFTPTAHQPQQQHSSQNIFQQAQPSSNPGDMFAQASQQPSGQPPLSSSLYSRMEDLTQEEINAFKSEAFEPGKLPLNPPPRELVN